MSGTFPALEVPVVRTANLRGALAHYRAVLGFEVQQEITGVLGIVRLGPALLQLWQCPGPVPPRVLRVQVSGLFRLYGQLAGRTGIRLAPPQLRPWGAWEFSLDDGLGNSLVFVQWASAGAAAAGGQPGREQRAS
jgi:hypothetical protein